MRRGLFVPLIEPAHDALVLLAESEWRDPRVQAAKLLTEALQQRGLLSGELELADAAAEPADAADR